MAPGENGGHQLRFALNLAQGEKRAKLINNVEKNYIINSKKEIALLLSNSGVKKQSGYNIKPSVN